MNGDDCEEFNLLKQEITCKDVLMTVAGLVGCIAFVVGWMVIAMSCGKAL